MNPLVAKLMLFDTPPRRAVAAGPLSYAQYQAAAALRAPTNRAWEGDAQPSTYRTTVGLDGGTMEGTPWLGQFLFGFTTTSRAVQHMFPSEAVYRQQQAAAYEVVIASTFASSVFTPGLNRNGFTSAASTTANADTATSFFGYYDPVLGPLKMNPRLGLGPVAWDMLNTVY